MNDAMQKEWEKKDELPALFEVKMFHQALDKQTRHYHEYLKIHPGFKKKLQNDTKKRKNEMKAFQSLIK